MSLLVGPRRTGKSVLLKQLGAKLIASGTSPSQILYFEFKQSDSPEIIRDIWEYFTIEIADPKIKYYLFFDEIQFVKDYEIEIKQLYDLKPEAKMFLTGSLSLTYKRRMSESLAGRFLPFYLYPLSFAEYLVLTRNSELDNYRNLDNVSAGLRVSYLDNLNREFRRFLTGGRLPELATMKDESFKIMYIQSVLNQSLSQDAFAYFQIEKPAVLTEIFNYVRVNPNSIINLTNLSKISSASKETVSKYLDVLEVMRLIYPIYNSLSPFTKFNAARKVYTSSHFIDSKYDPQTSAGLLVESYILERLLEQDRQVTFFRRRNKEVDFILPKENLAYEIKFRRDFSAPQNPLPKNFELQVISATGNFPACLF